MTSVALWKRGRFWQRILLIGYVLAFVGATYNHVTDLIRMGWLPYSKPAGVPFGLNVYWTFLTFLDPLSVIVLIISVEWGLALYGLVMVSDVSINWYAQLSYWRLPMEQSPFLIMQSGFLVFLAISSPLLIHSLRGGTRRREEKG